MPDPKETLGRRSARTFSTLAIGRFIGLLIGIASLIVIARFLGPEEYGVYTFAFAFYLLISAANNFGFGAYLTKYLAQYQDSGDGKKYIGVLSSGYLSMLLVGLVLTGLGIALSGPIALLYHNAQAPASIFILGTFTMFFSMIYGTADNALIGMGKNVLAVIIEAGENVILLAASVILIIMGFGASGAIAGMLASYVIAGFVGTYYVFWLSKKHMKEDLRLPSRKEIVHAFKFSIPVAANNILGNGVMNFSTIFLGLFVSAYLLGNYGIANRVGEVIALSYGTIAITILPTLAISASRKAQGIDKRSLGSIYNKVLLYSLIATVPVIAFLGVYARPVINLTITSEFGEAPLYLMLISLGTIIGLLGIYTSNLFVAVGKTVKMFYYTLIATVIQLVALVVLTPVAGVFGVIAAIFFVGSIATDYLFVREAKVSLGIKIRYGKILRIFASNAVMALIYAAGFMVPGSIGELAFGVVALIAAYPVILVLFGAFDKEDVIVLEKSSEGLRSLRAAMKPMLGYFKLLTRYSQ